ncbi:MAG TPA: phosphoribosylformylglycinamidine synthase subunit PurL [candidate division Zixibacteria bacterium]|nr:phosphoribosylformylglycinamidine synthase subunit PurL [candidate division Zixibacteria bacterium]
MKEPTVDLALAREHGLTEDEFNRVVEILGRMPSFTELGIFSVMWSEHCSYKSSIKYLKRLPREGEHVLAKAGEENAGALDIGDGKAVVFKIESHNHPSALEPYQGAATGVGGILRDIFSMGARPIAAMDSLRFGELSDPKQQHLFNGVVEGIAGYGNCFGVPTVGGEVVFDSAYNGNCLVNAMAVGIADSGKLMPAKASGTGNPVFILGATTGRDGIHGATFASVELSDKSAEDRSSVQIGDPFLEKLLLEATLEIIDKGLAVGIQDMGAAGITCSGSEMAAGGGVGIELDLDRVPLREEGMIPYEILLSESQERMLIVGIAGREAELRAVAEKWELNIEQIGEVTEGDRFVCRWHGDVVCDIPADSLVLGGGAPVYNRPFAKPANIDIVRGRDTAITTDREPLELLESLLAMPTIASKRWVFEQYDHQVGTNTVVKPGTDSALVRVKGTSKFLAISTDCNGRYCALDPYAGAMQAVAESARNVVAVGAWPIGITNCLNFGNPEKPESYWQFVRAVEGMGDACRALNVPVTGGNVSFYNESQNGAIYPTPVIGMLGIVDGAENIIPQHFSDGLEIFVVGKSAKDEFGGSSLQKLLHREPFGLPPKVDMDDEIANARFIHTARDEGFIEACHDISDGGIGVAVAESCIWGNVGAELTIPDGRSAIDYLFGESQGRYLIAVKADNIDNVNHLAKNNDIYIELLGSCGGSSLTIHFKKRARSAEIESLKCAFESAIPNAMKGEI